MFEQLALLDHPNIVKLHKYWLDASEARARVSQGHSGAGPAPGGAAAGTHPQLAEPASPPAPQVVFITEYVSSGSLKQFLKKTKKNHKAMNARVWGVGRGGGGRPGWRWCGVRGGLGDGPGVGLGRGRGWGTAGPAASPRRSDGVCPTPGLEALVHADPVCAQVRAWACPCPGWPRPRAPPRPLTWLTPSLLPSPRSFLHACNPPIIHGNLTSDTIFIQHNGLIKIGSGEGGRQGGAGGGARGPAEPWNAHRVDGLSFSPVACAVWHRIFSNGAWGPWGMEGRERSAPLMPRASCSAARGPPEPHPRGAGGTAKPALLPARVRR